MLRTAILRNLRPTSLILRKQPHSKWSKLDFILLEAFQIHEDEISSNSGLPVWITRSLDPSVRLAVDERADQADALLAEWDKKHSGDKKKAGISRFVVVLGEDGKPLDYGGLTRQRFSEAAIQEQQESDPDLEGIDIDRDRPEGGYDPADYG